MIVVYIFIVLMLLGLLLAFTRGGSDERWGASVLASGALLTPLVQSSGFLGPEMGIFAIDAMLLMMLAQLALNADRYWPLAAVAFQINTVLMHLAELLFPAISAPVYADVTVFWAFLVQLSLIAGILLEGERAKV